MTPAWMSGYVGDVAYTLGFYRELAPSFLNFACIVNGVEGLPVSRRVRYCELGCGRGYGTTLLAAANPDTEFVGIDFNPSHVAEARALASRAGIANVTFLESSFGDAARMSDPQLSEFDVIVLHGVYTWVERRIREDIHEFIRAKLVSGGIVYVSYNTLPGWAPVVPVQRMLMEIANRSSGDSIARISKGKETLKLLLDKSSGFVMQNPALKTRLAKMQKQDNHYLVHEFLNTGWEPLFVTDMMAGLAEAKLTYVGSATIGENRVDMCVPKDLRDMVKAAPDAGMRELLKDYVINKQFRRDIYVKGPQRLAPRDQRQRFSEFMFGSLYTKKEAPEKLRIPIGEVTPKKEALETILGRLKDKPVSGANLISEATTAGASEENAWLLIEMLVHGGIISPARPDAAKPDRAGSRRLNEVVMEISLSADTHRFLASPVAGSAIGASFLDRIVAPIMVKNAKLDDLKIAGQAYDRLNSSGQKLRRQGQPMERTDDNLREIARIVSEFREQRLPRWRALQIVD